ncbi:MAG: hypothetical protein H6737_11220 [Alphaproteobacteria bacterium]|nr:hypothetical protein [Alphaproteobacteria bacterium]
MTRSAPVLLLAAGCAPTGTWEVQTWGEDLIEQGIPAEVFEDGCAATFTVFEVSITEASLVDGDGSDAAAMASPARIDLTSPGPHALASLEAPATHYDTARFRIAPDGDAPSVRAAGTLTCGADTVAFDWSFDTDTTYRCEPEDLTIPGGGSHTTELTVHGDHLFYDGLSNPDALVRGTALLEADTNADGEVTQDELAAIPIAPLGYQVGPYADVVDLEAFVAHLTQSVGHVDGEGHCGVDL